MAVTFIESGTDATQDFSFYFKTNTTGSATITSDNTLSKDGSRSIKCLTANANETSNAVTVNAVVGDTGAVVSGWFAFSTINPSVSTSFMCPEQASDGSVVIGVAINPDGTLQIKGRGCTGKNGSTVLSANTFYRISLSYVITTSSNWIAKLYINGATEVTTSNADGTLTLTTTSCVQFGQGLSSVFSTLSAAMTIWIDSIYIDNRTTNTDCGNIHVTAKRPVSNGTTNGFTTQIGAGGSGYGSGHSSQVNEQPLSTTNGWSMVGAGAAVTEEYNIEAKDVGDVSLYGKTIVEVMGWVYSSALAIETAQLVLNGVNSNISLTTTNTMFTVYAGSTAYPSGTGADIGIITDTTLTTVSLFECGVVIAYVESLNYGKPIGSLRTSINGGTVLRPRPFAPGIAR